MHINKILFFRRCSCEYLDFLVLFILSAIISTFLLFVVDGDSTAGCSFMIILLVIVVISGFGTFGFLIGHDEVVTSEETELPPPQELVRLATTKDAECYLVQNGGKFQFSYIDETDGLVTKEADIEHSKVYYDAKESDDIRVVIYKTTKVHHDQWLFIRDGDSKEILYEYDFHIPSRDNIANTYEK